MKTNKIPEVYKNDQGLHYYSTDGGGTNCFGDKVFYLANSFTKEGYAIVCYSDWKWFFLNLKGVNAFNNQVFKVVYEFRQGYALVQFLDGTWGFLDLKGVHAFNGKVFDDAWPFHKGFARIQIDGIEGRMDLKGNITYYE